MTITWQGMLDDAADMAYVEYKEHICVQCELVVGKKRLRISCSGDEARRARWLDAESASMVERRRLAGA